MEEDVVLAGSTTPVAMDKAQEAGIITKIIIMLGMQALDRLMR